MNYGRDRDKSINLNVEYQEMSGPIFFTIKFLFLLSACNGKLFFVKGSNAFYFRAYVFMKCHVPDVRYFFFLMQLLGNESNVLSGSDDLTDHKFYTTGCIFFFDFDVETTALISKHSLKPTVKSIVQRGGLYDDINHCFNRFLWK